MSAHFAIASRIPLLAAFRGFELLLVLSGLLIVAAGCWSEVEYEPDEEPVAEQSTAQNPTTNDNEPAAVTASELPPAESPTTDSAVEATSPAPSEPETAEPAGEPVVPPADPATTSAKDTLTFEEWFGIDETEDSEPPPADEAPALPAVETAPIAEESPDESLPSKLETTPPSPEAPAVGDRYATVPLTVNPDPPTEALAATDGQTGNPSPWEIPPGAIPVEPVPADSQPAESEPAEVAPVVPDLTDVPAADTPLPLDEPVAGIASPEPATVDAEPTPPVQFDPNNTRHAAWLLGSKWSLLLLSEHQGAPEDTRLKWFDECRALAKSLGVKLPTALPNAVSRPTAAFVESMLAAGRDLGAVIGAEHGADETALFEVAMKSNLPLVLGDSRPDLLPAIARSVTAAAERAKLPNELVQAFTSALSGSPSPERVKQSVYDFHHAVEDSLRAAQ